LQADYQSLNQSHQDTQKQHQTIIIAHHSLQQQQERIVEQHQKLTEHFDTKNQVVMDLQFQLKTNTEKTASLESALSKAEDKIFSLR
jgi:peptidoglycan hydrolase CwlO-like protein